MKNSRKGIKTVVVVLLVGLMLFSMAACGKTPAENPAIEAIRVAEENMASLESMTSHMVMDMEMSVMGMDIPMLMDMDMETINEPMIAKITGSTNMGDYGSYDMEMYMEPENEGMVIYTGMDYGEGDMYWMKQSVDMDAAEISQYNARANIQLFLESADSFTEVGAEDINGVSTTRYDGVITGEGVSKVLASSGLSEQVGMDLEEYADLAKEAGDIGVSFWVDTAEKIIVQYEMDMSQVIQNMMDKVMAEEGEESGDIGISISKSVITLTVTGVNNVSEITIPEEVKENAEDMEALVDIEE